jgi:hypothetical protein
MIQDRRKILEDAKKRNGETTTDRRSAYPMLMKFEYHRSNVENTNIVRGFNPVAQHTSFVEAPYLPSASSLHDLREIYFRDLRLGTHHRGNYLLVRALAPAYRINSILALVEDQKGDALKLQLYQQPGEAVRPATSIIDTGDIFLLKEPYFKVTADGQYGLRVDHVSDIVRVTSYGPLETLIPSRWNLSGVQLAADELKDTGDRQSGQGWFWAAVER